jgi:hypothetical protein
MRRRNWQLQGNELILFSTNRCRYRSKPALNGVRIFSSGVHVKFDAQLMSSISKPKKKKLLLATKEVRLEEYDERR